MAEITLFTEKVRNPVDNSWIALRQVKGDDTTGDVTSIQNLSPNGSVGLCITAVTSPITAATTVSAGTTIKHANSGVVGTIFGITATTTLTPPFGATFDVPGFKVNATGHITSAGSHSVKIPNTTATTTADGLMPSAAVAKLNRIVPAAVVSSTTPTQTGVVIWIQP